MTMKVSARNDRCAKSASPMSGFSQSKLHRHAGMSIQHRRRQNLGADLKIDQKPSRHSLLNRPSGIDSTASTYAERQFGGHFIEINVSRDEAALYDERARRVQTSCRPQSACRCPRASKGWNAFPINLRYPQNGA
jgi:hypothetical protein